MREWKRKTGENQLGRMHGVKDATERWNENERDIIVSYDPSL